jgi:hypothetical protein
VRGRYASHRSPMRRDLSAVSAVRGARPLDVGDWGRLSGRRRRCAAVVQPRRAAGLDARSGAVNTWPGMMRLPATMRIGWTIQDSHRPARLPRGRSCSSAGSIERAGSPYLRRWVPRLWPGLQNGVERSLRCPPHHVRAARPPGSAAAASTGGTRTARSPGRATTQHPALDVLSGEDSYDGDPRRTRRPSRTPRSSGHVPHRSQPLRTNNQTGQAAQGRTVRRSAGARAVRARPR